MTASPPNVGLGRTSDAWAELMAAIGDLPRLVADPPSAEHAEGVRYLLRFLSAGLRVCVEADEPEAPMLTRSIEHRMSWGLDNPDTTYLYARVEPGATYRLRGDLGTARHVEVQVNTGHQGDGDFAGWRSTWWRSRDDLDVAADGSVDVEVPPTEGASFLFVRQYFSDWATERPATLDLQRTDVDLPPSPLTDEDLEARLRLLTQWLRAGADCWADLSRGFLAGVDATARSWSVQPFIPPDEASGLKGQAYGMVGWRCERDEAVVLTMQPPRSRYWGVSLCDRWWQSIDFAQRQSSLNDSQAQVSSDGTVTMVIAHADPGVTNWLDPGGRSAGSAAVRFLLPETSELPAATFERMPLAGLDRALDGRGLDPVTAGARARSLRGRQEAVARRLRW